MRALRHPLLQRFLSAGLLLSLTLWLAVPVTGATRTTIAAQAEGLGLPPEVEAALREALAATRTAGDFTEALAATLSARPDGEALAEAIEAEPTALLALLYGHLFQAFGHPDGPLAVPAVTAGATAGSTPVAAAVLPLVDRSDVAHGARVVTTPPRVVLPVALLTAAQPLGP